MSKDIKHKDWRKLEKWDWPYLRYSDGIELECPHGVGHSKGVHGCDGCCSHPSFYEAIERSIQKHDDVYRNLRDKEDRV